MTPLFRILDVTPGSREWLDARLRYRCASDAPIIMGAGKITREEFLRLKSTGAEREFSDWVQKNLLDRGHEVEAKARPLAELQLGEELSPIVVVRDDLRLLSSLDGGTMDYVPWEHKLLNEWLVEQIKAGEIVDPLRYWQLEHQLLTLPKAPYVLLTCSDGTAANFHYLRYERVPGRAERLMEGWEQFDRDLSKFVYTPVVVPVKVTVDANLPTLDVRMEGVLKVIDNLEAFGRQLEAFIKTIPAEPSTDEEFAFVESACKKLKTAEEELTAAEDRALASLTHVNAMRKAVETFFNRARDTRLAKQTVVTNRKQLVRKNLIDSAKALYAEYLYELNAVLGLPPGKVYMPALPVDFAAAISGKKTVQGCKDAIAQALATAKIEAGRIHRGILANLNYLREHAAEHAQLFKHDTAALVLKAPDDLAAVVTARISEHKAAEEKRLEKIREEERAKLQSEQDERDRKAAQALAQTAAAPAAAAPALAAPVGVTSVPNAGPAPGGNVVVPIKPAIATADTRPDIPLGRVCERLGFTVTSEFLAQLGFPHRVERSAKMYKASDFPLIVAALVAHLHTVAAKEQRAA